MAEKLEFHQIPLYIKIFVVIGMVFGVVGAALSFAGPAVGLNNDPADLKAVNLAQIEDIPEMVAYMDCGDLEDALETIVSDGGCDNTTGSLQVSENDEGNDPCADADEFDGDSTNTREPSKSLKDYCNDKKAPRYFVAVFSGTFTLVGVLTFACCMMLKRPAPEFVYVVPLLLSFVMLYDFLDFNTEVMAYVKDCTLYDVGEDDIEDKLQFIILWGQENCLSDCSKDYMRLGMMNDFDEDGNTCTLVSKDVVADPESEDPMPNCKDAYADHHILCSDYYVCNEVDDAENNCGEFELKESGVHDKWREHDNVIKDIGSGMIMWSLGSMFNIVSMGILMCTSFTIQVFVLTGVSGATGLSGNKVADAPFEVAPPPPAP